jgi:hypothetical protein
MTYAALAHGYATWLAENLSRFSFCWARFGADNGALSWLQAETRPCSERQHRTGRHLKAWSRPTSRLVLTGQGFTAHVHLEIAWSEPLK